MSLLDRAESFEPCNVYPEIRTTDVDGNIVTKASNTPIAAVARFQVENQSGTSARRAETDTEGYATEQVYRVRFPRSFTATYGIFGPQSKIGWGLDSQGREAMWSVFGQAIKFNGSRRTSHINYTIRRA